MQPIAWRAVALLLCVLIASGLLLCYVLENEEEIPETPQLYTVIPPVTPTPLPPFFEHRTFSSRTHEYRCILVSKYGINKPTSSTHPHTE